MRILIASTNVLTRAALRLFLREEGDYVVVGEAGDSEQLLAGVEKNDPNLVLLEWDLPDQPMVNLLSRLRDLNNRLNVLVLSGRPELEEATRAAGADGFFYLGEPPGGLIAMLQAIGAMGPTE